jgi:hypothetical protein
VNPNAGLRYAPALTTPESSFETAADADFLTGLDEEDDELAGWLVCARTEIVAQAVIPRIVILRIRIPRMSLMFPSYKNISRAAFGHRRVRSVVLRFKGKGGRSAAHLVTGH